MPYRQKESWAVNYWFLRKTIDSWSRHFVVIHLGESIHNAFLSFYHNVIKDFFNYPLFKDGWCRQEVQRLLYFHLTPEAGIEENTAEEKRFPLPPEYTVK